MHSFLVMLNYRFEHPNDVWSHWLEIIYWFTDIKQQTLPSLHRPEGGDKVFCQLNMTHTQYYMDVMQDLLPLIHEIQWHGMDFDSMSSSLPCQEDVIKNHIVSSEILSTYINSPTSAPGSASHNSSKLKDHIMPLTAVLCN